MITMRLRTARVITIRVMTIWVVTMFLIAAGVQAQDEGASRTTLRGISAVYVVVEDLSDSAKALGLATRDIQTDVELQLVIAGLNVVTREEGQKLPGRPFIYVRITLTKNGEAAYIAVELDQDAQLERNNQRARVTTWDTGTVSAHPTAQVIRDVVKDEVGDFLNAWLSANPNKK